MSQWGKERVFIGEGGSSVTALCDVDTIGFSPIRENSKIWWVGIMDSRGEGSEVKTLSDEAMSYIGKPYSDWLRR